MPMIVEMSSRLPSCFKPQIPYCNYIAIINNHACRMQLFFRYHKPRAPVPLARPRIALLLRRKGRRFWQAGQTPKNSKLWLISV